MHTASGLAPDYPTARARYQAAVARTGARVRSHSFPQLGPAGEDLAIDEAWFGPEGAERIVVVVSGTHGVEGYAGSMCQSRWLEDHPDLDLPEGVALAFVHAFNPFGFAWVRRVNEDNVDLNRNFADLASPPANPGYEELSDALTPATWTDETRAQSQTVLLDWADAHGFDALQAAVSGGQYHHPEGLFYGGSEPVRSHRVMRELVETRLAGADRVILLDLHTGLGEWGEVELITSEPPGSPAFERARAWWGDQVASTSDGGSVSAPLAGEWMTAAQEWLQPAEVTAVALEWGTVDSVTVLQALRADNWLHQHGDPTGPEAVPVKTDLRAAFAPDDPAWVEQVYECFASVLQQSLRVLGSPSTTDSSDGSD